MRDQNALIPAVVVAITPRREGERRKNKGNRIVMPGMKFGRCQKGIKGPGESEKTALESAPKRSLKERPQGRIRMVKKNFWGGMKKKGPWGLLHDRGGGPRSS